MTLQRVISHDNVGDGVELGDYGTYANHVIEDSEFYNNADRGIYLVAVDNVTVRRTKSYGNQGTVTDWHQGGIIAYKATRTTLTDNEVYNNAGSGIHLYKENYSGLTSSLVQNNKAYGNLSGPVGPGSTPGDGIRVYLSNNVTLSGNEAYGNARHGIVVGTIGQFGDLGNADTANNNFLTNNSLHNNSGAGLVFQGSAAVGPKCNTVQGNSFYNNATYGLDNQTPLLVTAKNNWWGANNGPSVAGSGSGDAVSINVDYEPWLVIGVSASPTSIPTGGATSIITADMTKNSAGEDTSVLGYIPDGTAIVFTTDEGSIGSLTTTKPTINGKATATLTSGITVEIATVTASAPPHGLAATVSTTVDFVFINAPPVAEANGPYVVAVGQAVALDHNGSYDPDSDPLTDSWVVTGNPLGTTSGETFLAGNQAGITEVTLTVNDGKGGIATDTAMVVVYDPSGGFVTGGGWIMSPVRAYTSNPGLTGKATFGFVAKYKKGANVPDGNTEFQFKAGDLNFHSTSYEWLVVAGTNAKFKGVGTINGQGTYKFMITADDGSPDKFRIQIWDAGDGLVYDNGSQQALGGGSIVIHK